VFDLVERSLDGSTHLVAPVGDLDAATNPAFRDAVDAALGRPGERVVIDLTDVSFMSAGAIGVIARARARLADSRGRLTVVCPSPRLRRLFDIAGISSHLEIVSVRPL
jgi:anti-sigma B factor antagonist